MTTWPSRAKTSLIHAFVNNRNLKMVGSGKHFTPEIYALCVPLKLVPAATFPVFLIHRHHASTSDLNRFSLAAVRCAG
jgi:hypothetical protein